jgi:hypothetical protein
MLDCLGDADLGRGGGHHLTAPVSAGLRCAKTGPDCLQAVGHRRDHPARFQRSCRQFRRFAGAMPPRLGSCRSPASTVSLLSPQHAEHKAGVPVAPMLSRQQGFALVWHPGPVPKPQLGRHCPTCTDPSPAGTGPLGIRPGRISANLASSPGAHIRCGVMRRLWQIRARMLARPGSRDLALICICLGPEDAVDGGTK